MTGPTGVGKSTLSLLTMRTSLNAMDFDSSEKGCMTKDMFDKYDSTYTSDIMGVYMDDLGNGKAEFTETSPTDVIIKFFNNVSAQAVKAELNAKGVVFIAFKCGVITSNLEDYGVRFFSNCPESALRRFYHTRVTVLDKYRMPGSLCLDTSHPELQGGPEGLCKNVWRLTMQECVPIETSSPNAKVGSYRWKIMTVNVNGKPIICKDIDLKTYLDIVVVLSERHLAAQTNVLERARTFNKLGFCKKCKRPDVICDCPSECKPQTDDVVDTDLKEELPIILEHEDDSLWSDPMPTSEEMTSERKQEIYDLIKNHLVGFELRHISEKMMGMPNEQLIVYCGPKFQDSIFQEWLEANPNYWKEFNHLQIVHENPDEFGEAIEELEKKYRDVFFYEICSTF